MPTCSSHPSCLDLFSFSSDTFFPGLKDLKHNSRNWTTFRLPYKSYKTVSTLQVHTVWWLVGYQRRLDTFSVYVTVSWLCVKCNCIFTSTALYSLSRGTLLLDNGEFKSRSASKLLQVEQTSSGRASSSLSILLLTGFKQLFSQSDPGIEQGCTILQIHSTKSSWMDVNHFKILKNATWVHFNTVYKFSYSCMSHDHVQPPLV